MLIDRLIDDLLDSYGILETAHDRLCSSIEPGTLDRAKVQNLSMAIGEYLRAIQAFTDYSLPMQDNASAAGSARRFSTDMSSSGSNIVLFHR